MVKVQVYQIDEDVPIPEESVGRLPIGELNVGDSFAFPLEKRRSVQTIASKLKREEGKEFTVRKETELEARVWRTR